MVGFGERLQYECNKHLPEQYHSHMLDYKLLKKRLKQAADATRNEGKLVDGGLRLLLSYRFYSLQNTNNASCFSHNTKITWILQRHLS